MIMFVGQYPDRNTALLTARQQIEEAGFDPKSLNLALEREIPIVGNLIPQPPEYQDRSHAIPMETLTLWKHEMAGVGIKPPEDIKSEEIIAYEREKASWGEVSSGEAPSETPPEPARG